MDSSWTDWSRKSSRLQRGGLTLIVVMLIFLIFTFYFDLKPGDLNLHIPIYAIRKTQTPLLPVNSTELAIVTARYGSSLNKVYERSCELQHSYALQHGYVFWLARAELVPGIWTKIADILEMILNELEKPEESRLKWVFWLDSDALIVNVLTPLTIFLPPPDFDHINFIAAKDWNGLNAGAFFIRVHSWSVEFLGAVLGYRAENPEKELVFLEQTAMALLLEEDEYFQSSSMLEIPQRWFNAYPAGDNEQLLDYHFHHGDTIVHFAGQGDREARISVFMDKIDQHLPEYEIPMKHLNLPAELNMFWEKRREIEREEQSPAVVTSSL